MEKVFRSSLVKNKIRRQTLYSSIKKERRKQKKLRREQREKNRKLQGEDVSMHGIRSNLLLVDPYPMVWAFETGA
jgi:hypothetical protein